VYRNADGSSRVEYLPVRISRWAPGERVYGDQAPEQSKPSPPALPARRAS
jgi:hypothetical protein